MALISSVGNCEVVRPLHAKPRSVYCRAQLPRSSARRALFEVGDLLREIGPWEGETGADLDALFTRQPGNRRVPDLP